MPFPVAGSPDNHPQYSGLLIPQIWSPRILEKFYEFSVLEHISNTNYEGEIRNQGDKVHIRLRPSITIRDHTAGQRLEDFDRPTPGTVELDIDRGKSWNFMVDDVNQAQADYDYMLDWTQEAAESMNEVINEIVLQEVPADVHADNQGANAGTRSGYFNLGAVGTPLSITKANVMDVLSDTHVVLSEQKVPESGRWMVIPPWMKGLIFSSDLRNALVTGNDQELLRKGHIGNLAGFDLFESNQLLTVDDTSAGETVTNILAGHDCALTFASQLTNSRVIQHPEYWGVFSQGLNVFGFEAIKPDAMALVYGYRGTA